MNTVQDRDVLTINETLRRAKMEGMAIPETALRRWVKDRTLYATYTGRKPLIYWPNVVRLLCGESAQAKQNPREVTPCS